MLIEEYRGELLENIHEGRICVVDRSRQPVLGSGDVHAFTYYRSTSKPFQLLPLILHGLDKKYGLTDAEMTVCGASHAGQDIHIAALESIMQKAGLSEDCLIMKPMPPLCKKAYKSFAADGLPPRKLYHNCSGKHLALMILQRELTGDPHDYWRLESPAQQEVLESVAEVSGFPKSHVICGTDGCGVPVFAVPMRCIATAYMKLAYPAAAGDARLSAALQRISQCIAASPLYIRGEGYLCSILNSLPNFVAKFGAEGVFGLGLKKERLGISIKVMDGSDHILPLIICEILRQLDYKDPAVFAMLEGLKNPIKVNDNGESVGRYKAVFRLQ